MPIAKLIFNLPEERIEFETATKAHDWKYAMWDLDQWLRNEIKYNDNLEDVEYLNMQHLRDKLWELLQDRNLNFDE